jgi:riboflavin biosynthesis pyrimidine reductase
VTGDREFGMFCGRKTAAAGAARLAPIHTVINRASQFDLESNGDAWCRERFDGPFWTSAAADRPTVSIVFVQSYDGNTGTDDPASLGAGATDTHLIYEGLSRIAADGVAVGAATLHPQSFFSVWRRELVDARIARGLPGNPAQIVLTRRGRGDVDGIRLFNVRDVPVYVLTSYAGRERLAPALHARPWVQAIVADGPDALAQQVNELFNRGQRRISCVGGRAAASAFVDAGLVQDLYLTTSPLDGGDPHTPWYVGDRPPSLDRVLAKTWEEPEGIVRFEHFVLRRGAMREARGAESRGAR